MDSCKPDFDNGIVNLMTFLADTMSVNGRGDMLAPSVLRSDHYAQCLQDARHVFLVVLDGLGYQYLRTCPESFLSQSLLGKMSSVFPSSTAPAISAYLSGLSPAMHGIFGWFQWMGAVGQVCASLPFESRALRVPLVDRGVQVVDCFSFSTFFERLSRPSFAYSPEAITFSPFNRYGTRGATAVPYDAWGDLVSCVTRNTQAAQAKTYQYIYWPFFDTSSHMHGLNSIETAQYFEQADEGVAQLVAALSSLNTSSGTAGETVVIVTADHGMMDTTPAERLQLKDFPAVADRLTMPLCGEPRAVYCHVRGSARADFPRVIADELGDYCDCYLAEAMVAEGWFGPEFASVPAHQYDALGDYILVMKGHYTLRDVLPGEKQKAFIGMHGGVASAEMEIPLCWMVC